MEVELTDIAEENLKRLDSFIAKRIVSKIRWFAENFDFKEPQALEGKLKGFYKLRVGDWRVVYSVETGGNKIIIHFIDHRSKVYKL